MSRINVLLNLAKNKTSNNDRSQSITENIIYNSLYDICQHQFKYSYKNLLDKDTPLLHFEFNKIYFQHIFDIIK